MATYKNLDEKNKMMGDTGVEKSDDTHQDFFHNTSRV